MLKTPDELRASVSELFQKGAAFEEQQDIEAAGKAYIEALELQQQLMDDKKLVKDLNALAIIYASIVLIGGTVKYSAADCLEKSTGIWQQLYKETGDEEFKGNRELLIKNYLNCKKKMSDVTKPLSLMVKPPEEVKLPLLGLNFNELLKITVDLGTYDILSNDDDEILIYIPFMLLDLLEEPRFYYDGGEHGILVKNHKNIVVCDQVNPGVRALLYTRKEVLFYEKDEKAGREQEYMVQLIQCEGVGAFANRLLRAIHK